MAVKKQTPPPIDRPLSKAYLRQFSGWSTAFPPGQSEPNSVRIMENMMVDRNGALAVRPGLRYLSYLTTPNTDPVLPSNPGLGLDLTPVGSQELFYTNDGSRALLFAVREGSGKVGFRVILFSGARKVVHMLTDPEIGFTIPQGEDKITFDRTCTHVQYLQLNNRILAMSDNEEPALLFYVGPQKIAKTLRTIPTPEWYDAHKISAYHVDASWINAQASILRSNILLNPSFEIGSKHWVLSEHCDAEAVKSGDAFSGKYLMELRSKPLRANLQIQPLHDPENTGLEGWHPDPEYGEPELRVENGYMSVTSREEGLFLVYGARLIDGVKAGEQYRVSFDFVAQDAVQPILKISFFSTNGAEIGVGNKIELPAGGGRFTSNALTAPPGTTAMRVSVGGVSPKGTKGTTGTAGFRNILVCQADEPTDMFHGDSEADYYYWTGTPNMSVSVYHPPVDITFSSQPRSPGPISPHRIGVYFVTSPVAKEYTLAVRTYDKYGILKDVQPTPLNATINPGTVYEQAFTTSSLTYSDAAIDLFLQFNAMARGDVVRIDAARIEPQYLAANPNYFDGSTTATSLTRSYWQYADAPHESTSYQKVQTTANPPENSETKTASTLIATGGAANNEYKIGLFYTFENEVGESAPSKITEVRVHRAWANWVWETPNAAGEPSGTDTSVAELCADQLYCKIPSEVYQLAVAAGALRCNLYAMSWSDQDPVPSYAQLIARKDLYPDPFTAAEGVSPVANGNVITITPSRSVYLDDVLLPTERSRVNYSAPPRHSAGLVAGDRLVLVGSPDDPASIQWSSNRPGEYTNFTANRGGGVKTLTSGNLNIPAAVVLWQNPQSINTITILCVGDDGVATSYYMAPASVTQGQSGVVQIMGFEETTSTPGSVSPYGGEVLNNAMYRPLDQSLLKSTASNYNISHKPMTLQIANMWTALQSKQWIMSAQLDNRLYYLVHNPLGEPLAPDCKGNEIWVYDVQPDSGTWSRFLIQGSALKVFKVGVSAYVGVTCPDGIYYLDPEARLDDYVDAEKLVRQRPIPWSMETNTQGANRAHDAWAHLQQVGIMLGNFKGKMQYGVRGHSVDGKQIDISKTVWDTKTVPDEFPVWDIEDALLIRRDMKEWVFYAKSLPGEEGCGQIGYVQYRYTPVSVNVGYEYGSVETFEYGRNAVQGPDIYTRNGIPVPMIDNTRP